MENAAKMMSGDVRSRTPAISAAICRSPQPRKNASSAVRSSEPITATTATVVDKRNAYATMAMAAAPTTASARFFGQSAVPETLPKKWRATTPFVRVAANTFSLTQRVWRE